MDDVEDAPLTPLTTPGAVAARLNKISATLAAWAEDAQAQRALRRSARRYQPFVGELAGRQQFTGELAAVNFGLETPMPDVYERLIPILQR